MFITFSIVLIEKFIRLVHDELSHTEAIKTQMIKLLKRIIYTHVLAVRKILGRHRT